MVARPPGDFVFVERETKVSGARESLFAAGYRVVWCLGER